VIEHTVRVTAEHIANGTRGWTGTSPVALAVGETFPGIPVDVYANWMHLCGHPEGCQDADLPWEAEEFLRAYDRGEEVAPVEFTVYWEPAEDEETPPPTRMQRIEPDDHLL
jgi:hypothetical protein